MFSGAHLHLLVNHAPIFGSLFAFALLVASYFTSADVLRKTALVVLVATAIAGAAADLSGDAAEDAIRGFPGVKREVIHAHEDMADKAYYLAPDKGCAKPYALLSSGVPLCIRGYSAGGSATPRFGREQRRQTQSRSSRGHNGRLRKPEIRAAGTARPSCVKASFFSYLRRLVGWAKPFAIQP